MLGVGSTFTQDDLDSGRVTYTHLATKTHADQFSFTVSDGGGTTTASNTYFIQVAPSNEAPTIAATSGTDANNTPFVKNGASAVSITGLSLDDPDYLAGGRDQRGRHRPDGR